MSIFLPMLGVVVTILAGWAMIRRYQTHIVLLFSGLILVAAAAFLAGVDILPKGVKPSGFAGFDIFNLLVSIGKKQASGIGFLIMAAGGFAAYMERIGAANALVRITVSPLRKLNSPYIVLVLGYLIGQLLVMVIPSAAGLAMLLLVALYPILKGVGVSPAAAVAVIGTSAGMTLGPSSGTANLAAKVAGLDPIIYFVQYQLPVAIATLIAVAVCHYFVQRYYDRKGDDVYQDADQVQAKEVPSVPVWYAVFPLLPIALMIIFSKLVISTVKLDTIAALFLVWVLVILVELIRLRSPKKIFKDAMAMFQSMGKMFGGIVALIICAEFFANGLKVSGVITALINSAQGIGAGMLEMAVILALIVGLVTFLTGSGVGAYSSFAALAPDVAHGLGGTVASLVTPMQFASGMFRAMSPVAGVIIAVAGAAGVTPIAVVRRTWLPMTVGMIVTFAANAIFIG